MTDFEAPSSSVLVSCKGQNLPETSGFLRVAADADFREGGFGGAPEEERIFRGDELNEGVFTVIRPYRVCTNYILVDRTIQFLFYSAVPNFTFFTSCA